MAGNDAYNFLQEQIAAISQYPNSGNQGIAVIQLSSAITAAISSFPFNSAAYEAFLTQMGFIDSSPLVDTYASIAYFLFYYYSLGYGNVHFTLNERITYLSKEKIIVLPYLGTIGIVKNQAVPLSVNVVQQGVCYWAENHFFGRNGILYRIILSQPKENIISI